MGECGSISGPHDETWTKHWRSVKMQMCHKNLEIKRNNTGCLWHELDVLSPKMGTVGGEISISSKDRGLVITDDIHSYPSRFDAMLRYIIRCLRSDISFATFQPTFLLRVWFHMMLSLFLIARALLSKSRISNKQEITARPFFFSSASLRSNGAVKGTWKLTGRRNHLIIEPEIWKLTTPINYWHLERLCSIVHCGLQIWNIYCVFVFENTRSSGGNVRVFLI